MSDNILDLFNPQIQSDSSIKLASNEYRPNPKNAKNGKYSAIIRFVPWVGDPSKSLMEKYISWLYNPTTQERRCVDNPRTWGEGRNPITDTFFLCQRTNRPDIQEMGKKCISTRQQFTSLVQIIRDNEHPELQGKILVWKFGKTIYDKIENEQNPQIGVGTNPFDPIHGRYFSLVITIVSNFPNYDQCSFVDYHGKDGETSGLWWTNPNTNKVEIATEESMKSEDNRQAFAEYLKVASPDLSKYDYAHWNEEETKFVNNIVDLLTSYVSQGYMPAPSVSMHVSSASSAQQPNPNPITLSAIPTIIPAAPVPSSQTVQFPASSPAPTDAAPQQSASISGITVPVVTPLASQSPTPQGLDGLISNLDDLVSKI